MKLKFSVLGEPAGKGRPRFRNAGAFVQTYTPEKTVSYPGVRVPIHHEGVKKMNRNLNEAIFDIAKVEAIMFAFENTYLELDVAPADRARADMATDAFYALWDAIRKVSDDLDRLAGDCRVVDAIYAVNDVRRRVGTLKTED